MFQFLKQQNAQEKLRAYRSRLLKELVGNQYVKVTVREGKQLFT